MFWEQCVWPFRGRHVSDVGGPQTLTNAEHLQARWSLLRSFHEFGKSIMWAIGATIARVRANHESV